MQYYEFLGQDGKEWLADFIALNFTVVEKYIKKYNLYRLHLSRYLQKYEKYKKRNSILWGVIVFLAVLLVSAIFYIGYKF